MNPEEMIEELTQFYEAAGFADYYERELKGKSDEEIAEVYATHVQAYGEDGEQAARHGAWGRPEEFEIGGEDGTPDS